MDKIFPYEICMKINMYAGHPIANSLKDSTIFKYLKLRNENEYNNEYYDFLDGCEHAQTNHIYCIGQFFNVCNKNMNHLTNILFKKV